jgi:UDP-N-acetylglucosamine--N-acetylmuramyl-(pentapeptide) pyrophosphoryl-undecaprenol N-acetylglucosamine transferase
VLGVGGYASGPGMAAALQLGIPTMALEPNAMPGLANRLVGKRVQAAAVNFASAAAWFRNAEVTGIPVRPEFFMLQPPTGKHPHLLVFGGSQGARIFIKVVQKTWRSHRGPIKAAALIQLDGR